MFLSVAVLLFSAVADDPINILIQRLHSDDPDIRAEGNLDLLSAWSRWKDSDLAELERVTRDRDPEVAGRAAEALGRIRIRKVLGRAIVDRIVLADEAFFRGSDYRKLEVLRESKQHWKAGTLQKSDLAGLESLAISANWDDPTLLDDFMKEAGATKAFSIEGDSKSRTLLRVAEVVKLGTDRRDQAGKVAEFLGDGAPEVRAAALRLLAADQARDQAPRVAGLLTDKRAQLRADAMNLLRSWGAKEYARGFEPLLEDPDQAIRRKAMEALGAWGQTAAGPRIAKLLQDPYAPSRADAAFTLGVLVAREFTSDVLPLLGDSHPAVRQSAAYALGKFGGAEFAPRLLPLLRDQDPEVRWIAAQSLGQLGSDVRTDPIADLLRDPNSEVASQAAWVIGFTASPEAVDKILSLLDSRYAEFRQRGVWTLGLLKARDRRADVSRLLKDPSSWVRSEAALTLARIGRKEDAAVLATLLRDPDRKVRVDAALALGELGGGDPEGVLASLERDPDRLLALASALSLVRLGKEGPAELRAALREIATDDLAFACLGTAASEVASSALDPATWAILERPLPARSIESWDSLTAALSGSGLKLDVRTECAIGRLDKSHRLSGRDALAWLFGRNWPPILVLDGHTVRLMDRRDSLAYWQARLEPK